MYINKVHLVVSLHAKSIKTGIHVCDQANYEHPLPLHNYRLTNTDTVHGDAKFSKLNNFYVLFKAVLFIIYSPPPTR